MHTCILRHNYAQYCARYLQMWAVHRKTYSLGRLEFLLLVNVAPRARIWQKAEVELSFG